MKVVWTTIAHARAQPGFLGLVGATIALGIAYAFVMPYLSLWASREIGLSSWQFGAFMTASGLSAMGLGTALARWSDVSLSRRTTLAVGALGGICGYLGYAWFHHPLILVAIGATCVALSSTCFPQLFAHVRERFAGPGADPAHGPLSMSLIRVCFSVAWTLGPAVGGFVVQQAGFHSLFVAAALLYAIFLWGVWRFVPHVKPQPHAAAVEVPVWRVLLRRDVFGAFTAFMAVFAAHAMNMMNLPLVITEVLGGSAGDIGLAFGVGPLVEVPLMIWFGHLGARGHQRALIVWGVAATVLYFLLLGLATAPWQILPIQILSGVSFAILTNVAILYFQDLLPGQAGLGTAIFSNAGNAGNLAGYLAFGLLTEPLGHRGLYGPCLALGVIALALILGIKPRTSAPAP